MTSASGSQILQESETNCDTDALLSEPEEVDQESLSSSTSSTSSDQSGKQG